MEAMFVVAQGIDPFLQAVARLFGWLLVALVVVICWDVITRKLGFQIPGFGSTPIQELDWHLHGMLFLFWLGYAYVRNVHVKVHFSAETSRKSTFITPRPGTVKGNFCRPGKKMGNPR